MNINLIGQRNIFGGGVHYRNFSESMKKVNLLGDFVREVGTSPSELNSFFDTATPADVHIFFYPISEQVQVKGFVVKWGIFETNKLPEQYLTWLIDSHLTVH